MIKKKLKLYIRINDIDYEENIWCIGINLNFETRSRRYFRKEILK